MGVEEKIKEEKIASDKKENINVEIPLIISPALKSSMSQLAETNKMLGASMAGLMTPALKNSMLQLAETNKIIGASLSGMSGLITSSFTDSVGKLFETQNKLTEVIIETDKLNIPKLLITDTIGISALSNSNFNINNVIDNKDLAKATKAIEFASVVNEINADRLNYINDISSKIGDFDKVIDEKRETIKTDGLVNPEEILPNFISYAYRKDSKYTISEAYEKSIIKDIEEKGEKITDYIQKINLIAQDKEKTDIFSWNRDTFQLAKKLVSDEDGFRNLSDLLFRAIYESSGVGNNRLFAIMKHYGKEEPTIIMNIKSFRSLNFHRLGYTEKDYKNIKRSIDYIKNIIKKHFPDSPSDWLKLQQKIYCDIIELLEIIYTEMNNDLSGGSLELDKKEQMETIQ